MKVAVGIDLGSTTTKAVLVTLDGAVAGAGVIPSRSDYEVASLTARDEAIMNARLSLVRGALARLDTIPAADREAAFTALTNAFHLESYLEQLEDLRREIEAMATAEETARPGISASAANILRAVFAAAGAHFAGGARRSEFFRDLAAESFMSGAERAAASDGAPFERLVNMFDRAIIQLESRVSHRDFSATMGRALLRPWFPENTSAKWRGAVEAACEGASREVIEEIAFTGTGYGRQTLPFPKEAVRSEILCHGRGAHAVFPGTRTVLDIGGQDTKAIQVDERGTVTSFQMNDRCAAGCGRYLGYIADELNLGLQELGPLAMQSRRTVKINSTCTVFAGAELRERVALGDRREDILAGLHHAVVVRAMSLLARSGGVRNEMTFTGGVCRNEMAVKVLRGLVAEHYGDSIHINIHQDSIFMGALGAALFARDDHLAGAGSMLRARAETPGADTAADAGPAHPAQAAPAEPQAAAAPVRSGIATAAKIPEGMWTAGIDVGSATVKAALAVTPTDGGVPVVVTAAVHRIRRRALGEVVAAAIGEVCARAGVPRDSLAYIASTGEGDAVDFRTGHFYSMTTHAYGARFLMPGAAGVLDAGALHTRVMRVDPAGRVIGQRTSSQCASGSGQFLENIARYLGVALEDVGALSASSQATETVSSICAVLAETDVINLVSRRIPAASILRGIHQSLAGRIVRLIGQLGVSGTIAVTGGLARDEGFLAALTGAAKAPVKGRIPPPLDFVAHADSIAAGAIGAALVGAIRAHQLAGLPAPPMPEINELPLPFATPPAAGHPLRVVH